MCIQFVPIGMQQTSVCFCRYKFIYMAMSGAFASHSLARFPICCHNAEFSKPELFPQAGTAVNTTDHKHFCMRSRKPRNSTVLFLRRPIPLRKLYPEVEMPTKEPAETKRQEIIEPGSPSKCCVSSWVTWPSLKIQNTKN